LQDCRIAELQEGSESPFLASFLVLALLFHFLFLSAILQSCNPAILQFPGAL
jgi:hypothetical protein